MCPVLTQTPASRQAFNEEQEQPTERHSPRVSLNPDLSVQVGSVLLTGSAATYDAIMWGDDETKVSL